MPRPKKNVGKIAGDVLRQPTGTAGETSEVRRARCEPRADGSHVIEFGRTYLPHIFRAPSPPFHYELVEALEERDRVAIAAPRGHAKTQVVTIAAALYQAVNKRSMYIVIIQATATMAEDLLEDISNELDENEMLRQDYGDLSRGGKWSQKKLQLSNGVRIVALGAGASMRGMVKKGIRPDQILGDDIDGDEMAESRSGCAKLKRWWKRAASNLLGAEGGKIFVVGTILHHDALLSYLLNNESYWSKIYRAVEEFDAGGNPIKTLWPEYWTPEKLTAKKKEIGSVAFEQEYQNNPVDPETQPFKPEVVEACLFDGEVDTSWPAYQASDLAISQKKTADYFINLVGWKAPDGTIWVGHGVRGRFGFSRQAEVILDSHDRFNTLRAGIESVAYQAAMAQTIREVGKESGRYIAVKELNAKGAAPKDLRIMGLVPLLEQRAIRISRNLKWLIDELLTWPKGSHDDAVDCLEMLVQTIRGARAKRYTGVLPAYANPMEVKAG
ncbi:MAG: hypothetical protein P9M15_01685 [Candidatus Electryoneaceae bacterium]|nr:hypothetical protein [Candidatus Electryoneaceae bacterium]